MLEVKPITSAMSSVRPAPSEAGLEGGGDGISVLAGEHRGHVWDGEDEAEAGQDDEHPADHEAEHDGLGEHAAGLLDLFADGGGGLEADERVGDVGDGQQEGADQPASTVAGAPGVEDHRPWVDPVEYQQGDADSRRRNDLRGQGDVDKALQQRPSQEIRHRAKQQHPQCDQFNGDL
jgi:hypothetical protein